MPIRAKCLFRRRSMKRQRRTILASSEGSVHSCVKCDFNGAICCFKFEKGNHLRRSPCGKQVKMQRDKALQLSLNKLQTVVSWIANDAILIVQDIPWFHTAARLQHSIRFLKGMPQISSALTSNTMRIFLTKISTARVSPVMRSGEKRNSKELKFSKKRLRSSPCGFKSCVVAPLFRRKSIQTWRFICRSRRLTGAGLMAGSRSLPAERRELKRERNLL